ncbi:hypothetical protein BC937DRAFT_89725 [Endogone sp. FLAS-F59071]|nr:hypothetical protein BC937DRAFT_89725 [Endogone sp. FLAS-F59071]|eukprot:RUS23255.1 hypothetical protein BC937DRAFT_89725 [Endogone sp. FLAS-F59071]
MVSVLIPLDNNVKRREIGSTASKTRRFREKKRNGRNQHGHYQDRRSRYGQKKQHITYGVKFAQENVTDDPERASGLGDVEAHETRNALVLNVEDVVHG